MVENVLNGIGGVGIYGIISVCLFCAVFVGVLVWTLGLRKPYLSAMECLPLDGAPTADPHATPNPEAQHD